MTCDYKRHGVTTLFAALDVLEGKVFGRCMKRYRYQEPIRFLSAIAASTEEEGTTPLTVTRKSSNGSKSIHVRRTPIAKRSQRLCVARQ
jgi:hypothetical protein